MTLHMRMMNESRNHDNELKQTEKWSLHRRPITDRWINTIQFYQLFKVN